MINRAKCKLCNSIITSYHLYDLVECSCGSISVGGSDSPLACAAKDWSSFVRVDDEGNEIIPKVIDNNQVISETVSNTMDTKGMIKLLDSMIEDIERMPEHAKSGPVNHYDYMTIILLISSMLKAK